MFVQEKIPIEEVFEKLKCTKEGLSTTEGEERLRIFGPNKLEEKKESPSRLGGRTEEKGAWEEE